jgi:hypothetical protein
MSRVLTLPLMAVWLLGLGCISLVLWVDEAWRRMEADR